MVADEYENGSSKTDWKEFKITVKGVNDNPVVIQPEFTEVIGNFKGEEQLIKLSDYFNDPDNDTLNYKIKNQLDGNSFIESFEIKDINDERLLAIKFKENIYRDDAKFDPIDLTIIAKDNNGGEVEKTFTIKLPPTVEIDIQIDDKIAEDNTYNVTVTTKDLINELLNYNYSNGFTSIKFSINIDPELCEINDSDIISSGTIKNFGYAILVEFTADQIVAMNDHVSVSFKVKSKANGIAEFSIGNYFEIFRNNNLINESQITHSTAQMIQ
jgi:hypothetical protein